MMTMIQQQQFHRSRLSCRRRNAFLSLSLLILFGIIIIIQKDSHKVVSSFMISSNNYYNNMNHFFQKQQQQQQQGNEDYVKLLTCNMFTGIVEDMGTIINFEERDDILLWDGTTSTNGTIMTIQPSTSIILGSSSNTSTSSSYIGCSISVSGVCLTATSIDYEQQQFTVGLAPETLRKTYFGHVSPNVLIGSKVNLERAAEMGTATGRNSGHYVQGHVDDVGTIIDRTYDNDSLVITIQLSERNTELMNYIVPKGFIAIDGTSLTVINVDYILRTFTFMLISYTQHHIIIPQKQIGDLVNIEVDILSKYANSNRNNYDNSSNNLSNEILSSTTVSMIEVLQQRLDVLERRVQELELNQQSIINK